jgi:hypothetical protein
MLKAHVIHRTDMTLHMPPQDTAFVQRKMLFQIAHPQQGLVPFCAVLSVIELLRLRKMRVDLIDTRTPPSAFPNFQERRVVAFRRHIMRAARMKRAAFGTFVGSGTLPR